MRLVPALGVAGFRAWVAAAIAIFCTASYAQPAGPSLAIFTTKHYEIHSNLTRSDAMLFGRHMDAVFDEYQARFRRANFKPRDSRAMPLYLLKTKADYDAFMGGHGVSTANTGGMFFIQRNVQGLATFVQGRPISETFSVLQHEGFHQFAFQYIGPELPVWINEGIAEYFEDGILARGRMFLNMVDVKRARAIQAAIRKEQTIPFDRMLSMSNEMWGQILARDTSDAGMLYDQAWSMVFFLIVGDEGRYVDAFSNYLRMVGEGRESMQAFADAFGSNDPAPFERAWKRFAIGLQPDHLAQALERLRFLGQGLMWFSTHNVPMPSSTSELRQRLRKIGYRAIHKAHGLSFEYDSRDDRMYGYSTPTNAEQMFRLLEPERSGLPPRLYAPGLSPEPTLVWYREGGTELMYDITFR